MFIPALMKYLTEFTKKHPTGNTGRASFFAGAAAGKSFFEIYTKL
jgi:hypothetical protein